MTAPAQPFNLEILEDGKHITRLMEARFDARVQSVSRVGQGFYAHIYRVELEKDPGVAILKCHKYAGRSAREQRQLELLKRHASVKVPAVYGLHPQSELFPAEALSMEHIPGINASKIEFPDEGRADLRFRGRPGPGGEPVAFTEYRRGEGRWRRGDGRRSTHA